MFHALALLIALVRPPSLSQTEICELPNAMPGRTATLSCMGCHDGTIASFAAVKFSRAEESASHLVDIDYAEAVLRRPGTLKPVAELPREVMLQNGKLTCLTCHHPDSPEPFRVAVSLDRSALCHACHLN